MKSANRYLLNGTAFFPSGILRRNYFSLAGVILVPLFLSLIFFPSFLLAQQSPSGNSLKLGSMITPEMEKAVRSTLKENSLKLQLIENNGQQNLPANVIAYFTSQNETVFIEKNRLRIVVIDQSKKSNAKFSEKSKINQPGYQDKKEYAYNSFLIEFKGSTGFSSFQKEKPFALKRNYFNTGVSDAKAIHAESFGEIILKNIYTGIDLRLYSQENGHLEFDWIVWPGADASMIKMEFNGQEKLAINSLGQLQIKLAMGDFNMRLPESYYITPQGKKNIDVKFSLLGNKTVHFLGFDKQQKEFPLVIDPDLLWGSYFDGGNSNFDEYLYAIDFNNSNQLLYCAGAASMQVSTAYAAALTSGYNGTFSTNADALIYAMTKSGQTLQYITYLGGSGTDISIGLSISNSFIYTCGYTSSSDFPITLAANGKWPAFDSTFGGGGNDDGFISVFNLDLSSLIYSSYLGSSANDISLTVRAIQDSVFYVSLQNKAALPTASPNYLVDYADNVFAGASEAWVGKFTSFNSLRFGTYIGGNNDDIVNDFQVLSDGDIVFVGNTLDITEVNASVADNGTGQEVLFGRLNVPVTGAVSFDIVDRIGGSNNDMGWGILSLGDSVSILVGQTNSNNFPLGTGTAFQSARSGNYDGFLAKINNDGTGGYRASFVGGNNADILVAVRPVVVNNQILLLAFGSTQSTDLATYNFDSGSLFSSSLAGGLDMMFVISNLNLSTKYYLSYLGGTANDYLGKTGAPLGANHLYFNNTDSVLYLGTTTHSSHTTLAPVYVGRGVGDNINIGVPVFDQTKSNGANDTHTIMGITTRLLFHVLPLTWISFESSLLSDCSVKLSWSTDQESKVWRYAVERSIDGKNFEEIGFIYAGQKKYVFNDNFSSSEYQRFFYRIRAMEAGGQYVYTGINSINLCKQMLSESVQIYPTIITNSFTVSGIKNLQAKNCLAEIIDATGKKLESMQLSPTNHVQRIYFTKKPATGSYIIAIRNSVTGTIIKTQQVFVRNN